MNTPETPEVEVEVEVPEVQVPELEPWEYGLNDVSYL